jgi:hypothetical protein
MVWRPCSTYIFKIFISGRDLRSIIMCFHANFFISRLSFSANNYAGICLQIPRKSTKDLKQRQKRRSIIVWHVLCSVDNSGDTQLTMKTNESPKALEINESEFVNLLKLRYPSQIAYALIES